MTSRTFDLRLTPTPRPRFRPRLTRFVPGRRATDFRNAEEAGTPVLRLVGVALLGWFGVMTVVAILAIYCRPRLSRISHRKRTSAAAARPRLAQ
jgi:hypothetical protein